MRPLVEDIYKMAIECTIARLERLAIQHHKENSTIETIEGHQISKIFRKSLSISSDPSITPAEANEWATGYIISEERAEEISKELDNELPKD